MDKIMIRKSGSSKGTTWAFPAFLPLAIVTAVAAIIKDIPGLGLSEAVSLIKEDGTAAAPTADNAIVDVKGLAGIGIRQNGHSEGEGDAAHWVSDPGQTARPILIVA